MEAKSVGSLAVLALRACSGTLDGSDKIEVALLRSRRDDNAANAEQKIVPFVNSIDCTIKRHSANKTVSCLGLSVIVWEEADQEYGVMLSREVFEISRRRELSAY